MVFAPDALFDAIQDVVFVHDPEGKLLFLSPSARRLGHDPEQLIGSSFAVLLPDETAAIALERTGRQMRGDTVEQPWDLQVRTGDGELVWIQIHTTAVYNDAGTLQHVVGIARVIDRQKELERHLEKQTDALRKRLEEQMRSVRESEQRFRELAEMFPNAIFETDPNGLLTYANQKAFEIFGYAPKTVAQGVSCFDMLAAEDAERAVANFRKRVGGELAQLSEYTARRQDGSTFAALLHAAPILRDGAPIGIRGLIIDISERKRIDQELRESEERYRLLLQNAPAGIYEIDISNQRLLTVNDVMCDFLGYSREELLRMSPLELLAEDSRPLFVERSMRALAGDTVDDSVKYRVRTRDGRELWALLDTKIHVRDGKPWRATVVAQDVSQLTELEEQLNQAQRMKALGTLAGGVAHDFNNLLMGIQGHVVLLADEAEKPDTVRDHALSIASYLESAAELTSQLLGLAQTGKYHAEPIEVARLVDGCVTMFARTKKEIPIHLSHHDPAAVVEADRAQIEQVLLNLLINAWQAMPDGGDIHIDTRATVPDSATLAREELGSGDYVCIQVRDTGVGMSAEVRRKVFEPFFTTKERGRGTGLGLASAYGIIKNHKGYIDVDSVEGEGSRFRVFLPVSTALPANDRPPVTTAPTRTTTVLVVDDEPHIARIMARLLVRAGHEVLVAMNGHEALALMEAESHRIELVVLDMIMPDMDGAETFLGLRKISPAVKIILSSGYSSQDTTSELIAACDGFLQKPWTPEQLNEKIEKALA